MEAAIGIATLASNVKIPKIPRSEISISIENHSLYMLTNVTMYFNGTSIIPVSPNIGPHTVSRVRFEAKLRRTKGMICYQIGETSNYLLISWKVPLTELHKNEFCIQVRTTRLSGREEEKKFFRKNIHNECKKFPDEGIQIVNDDIIVAATMSNR
ncbi:unnamed protein product [Rhizophagus irregularis]|nr:unnamed protein product [Rhizophagus irregularis]